MESRLAGKRMTAARSRLLARALLATATAAVIAAAGCGEADPDAALEEASAELDAAREQLEAADAGIREIRSEMREAEERLVDAERVRREAQRHVTEAEALLSERASDDVLFRAVQRRLLEDETLADSAVVALVADRVVTLRGQLANERLRARAVEVARSAPGVAEVVSELQIPAPASE